MPIIYVRDDESRFVSVSLSGAFDMGEVTEVMRHQKTDGTAGYALLVDARGLISSAKIGELSVLMQVDAQENTVRGPVAIVARDATVYGMACTYATMVGSRHPMQVFIDMDDAKSWLRSKSGATPAAVRRAG